ncbi:PKD domain-containing protein [Candidatus Woesearchaeota archaeon]|nr:PKD domain-containing protein [Candidatus Woesearchaeota archaeon]
MKFSKFVIILLLILLVIPIIYSAPPWKKQQQSAPTSPTQTTPTQTEPTVIEKTVIINNTVSLKADAGSDRIAKIKEVITFDGSGSYSLNKITKYIWNFGDGGHGEGIKVIHTYNKTGVYTVTLTVINSDNSNDLDSLQVIIQEEETNWEMIGVIIAILTIMIGVIGWLLTRKKSSTTSKYLAEINNTFNEYKNNSDQCELHLAELKSKLEKELSSGKLTEQSYDILDRKIETYLSSVRKGIVSQFNLTGEAKSKIDKILKDGKITKEEYESIKKLDLNQLDKNKKEKLLKLLKSWED